MASAERDHARDLHKHNDRCIHAVAAQVKELRATVSRDDARPEEMKLLEEWVEAAEDLERAYDTVAQTVLNLPPYDRLIHD